MKWDDRLNERVSHEHRAAVMSAAAGELQKNRLIWTAKRRTWWFFAVSGAAAAVFALFGIPALMRTQEEEPDSMLAAADPEFLEDLELLEEMELLENWEEQEVWNDKRLDS